MTALDVGFLGYGFMGDAHANAIARLPMFFPDAPTVERRVLIGRDEAALTAAADRLSFASVSTDWHTALDDLDVLYNLGPNHLHAAPTIEALERDVHVLCEKPLAPTVEAAERMASAASRSGALAGVAFNYRYVPALALARELIRSGELGEIRAFHGRYLQDWLADPTAPWSWRTDAELAGSGALGDLGAHTVDLARYLVGTVPGGGEIERVAGHLRTFVEERREEGTGETRPVTVDDAYTAQVAFEEGAMGTLRASRVARGHKNDHTIEVVGTDGSLRFSLERLNELEVHRTGDRGYETVLVTDPDDPYVDAWWPPGHVLGWEHPLVHQSYEFLRAVKRGDGYRPDFRDGLAVQRVLGAIEESDRTAGWIDI